MVGKRYRENTKLEKLKMKRKTTGLQFFFTAISLFIAVTVFVTSSVSWFSIKTSKLNAGQFTLECGKGLRVNDSGTSDFNLSDVDKYILPASSVDGRNIFFPTDGTDFSKKTEEITYRAATVGDKNENYIQIDFTLTAQANNTALYIDEDKTSLALSLNGGTPNTTYAAPLRLAIWSSATGEDGVYNPPVVFNPTNKTYSVPAVKTVDHSSGELQSTYPQVAHCFKDYSYGGEPLATLSKGEETHFSIIIWLEGADPRCTWDKVHSRDIELSIAFTTSWDKTQTIRFKDSTNAGWIKQMYDSGYSLALHYDKILNTVNADSVDFNMYPVDSTDANCKEWLCNMPGDMQEFITFVLTSPNGSEQYKFCVNDNEYPSSDITSSATLNTIMNNAAQRASKLTLNRGVNRLYEVKYTANTTLKSACRGHWIDLGDSDGGGSDVGDLDGDDF